MAIIKTKQFSRVTADPAVMAELLYKTEKPSIRESKRKESGEMFIRKHVYFYGRVQGVGFRWRAVQTAKDLHLTGWVRNMYNGNVEMEVQGNSVMIERLFQELHSDRFIRIEKTEMIQIPTVDDEADFSVRG